MRGLRFTFRETAGTTTPGGRSNRSRKLRQPPAPRARQEGRERVGALAPWFACNRLDGAARTARGAGGRRLPHAPAWGWLRQPVQACAARGTRGRATPNVACSAGSTRRAYLIPTLARLSLPKSSRQCIVPPMGAHDGKRDPPESVRARGTGGRVRRPAERAEQRSLGWSEGALATERNPRNATEWIRARGAPDTSLNRCGVSESHALTEIANNPIDVAVQRRVYALRNERCTVLGGEDDVAVQIGERVRHAPVLLS